MGFNLMIEHWKILSRAYFPTCTFSLGHLGMTVNIKFGDFVRYITFGYSFNESTVLKALKDAKFRLDLYEASHEKSTRKSDI